MDRLLPPSLFASICSIRWQILSASFSCLSWTIHRRRPLPMPTFFANPWGLLGLLAIPAILVIHMLREKSRRVRVSTLFLLPPLLPRTPHGRAIHFLQNSIPLWLQLLSALLATWLLADPR